MTQIGEGINPPAVEPPEREENTKKKPVSVRCILLYDGTGNNKTNIEAKSESSQNNAAYQDTRSKKYVLFGEHTGAGDDSYENGLTNIALLDGYMAEQAAAGYDITILVYTEGAGTINLGGDTKLGYGIGVGEAGVKNKCELGITKAVSKLINGKLDGNNLNPNEYYFKLVTVDVFGFSRGAATARFAIHQILKQENKTLAERLKSFGYTTEKVEVCFAGLFDTVSSHGINFSNNTSPLKLDAVRDAKKVLHLAAADEHRENFSLTNINSANGKGEEYFLPGVHSDIGGSYHDNTSESFTLVSGTPAFVAQDRANLIANGWYTESEIIYEEQTHYTGHGQSWVTAATKANRKNIRNAYCRIPLKIMAKSAQDQGVSIKSKLTADADALLSEFPDDLKRLDANIDQYKATSRNAYKMNDPLLMHIRNKHFHMSAKESLGLKPRFNKQGQRWREIYEG